MFRLVQSLGGQQKVIYPEFSSQTEGCDQFSAYFAKKVQNIHDSLGTLQCHGLHRNEMVCYDKPLASFEPTSDEEVSKIHAKMMKICDLDPFPSTLLKGCHASLVSLFTKLTNMSLAEAEMPTCLKEALVHPLIKKSSLDKDLLKNYRPVSSLPLLSWTRTCSRNTGL